MNSQMAKVIVDKLFKDFDADQNGYLDEVETSKLINTILSMSNKSISEHNKKELMATLDLNKDKKVTREELQYCLENAKLF